MPKKIGCQRKTFACPGVSAFLVCEIWTSPTPHGCPMQNESHIHYRRSVTMITTGYQHVHISNNTSHRLRSVKPVPTSHLRRSTPQEESGQYESLFRKHSLDRHRLRNATKPFRASLQPISERTSPPAQAYSWGMHHM